MAAHRWIFVRPSHARALAPILIAIALLLGAAAVEFAFALWPGPAPAATAGESPPIAASTHPAPLPQALPASQRSPSREWRWM